MSDIEQWANLAQQNQELLTRALEKLAAAELQINEYHEWVEAALKELPDWMRPIGHDEVCAALATGVEGRRE